MKKFLEISFNITILVIVVFTVSFVFVGDFVFAQEYVSISPLPNTENVNLDDPAGYFQNLFTIFIAIAGALAVVRLMLCGFTYMTSEAISTKSDAKNCIWAVIAGLFIILLSVLVLQQINKDFLKIDFGTIKQKIENAADNINSPESNTNAGSKIVSIDTFSLDKTYVHQGDTINATWSSSNATQCVSNLFDTKNKTSGTESFLITNLTGEVSVLLSCKNEGTSTYKEITITVVSSTGGNMSEYKSVELPFNKYCVDVLGTGWVNVDSKFCPDIKFSETCCGKI